MSAPGSLDSAVSLGFVGRRERDRDQRGEPQRSEVARAERGEGAERVVGGREAVGPSEREELLDDCGEIAPEVRSAIEEPDGVPFVHRAELVHPAPSTPRTGLREQLVEDDAEGEDIGATVEGLTAKLLGRDVPELPLHDARAGAANTVEGERDAEIGELYLPLLRHEDVVRGHVAMDEPRHGPVHGRERAEDGAGDVDRDEVGDLASRGRARVGVDGVESANERLEIQAVDELQHEEGASVGGFAELEERDDVRVADAGEKAGLLSNAEVVLSGKVAEESLDADIAHDAAAVVARAEDLARRAAADARDELEASPSQEALHPQSVGALVVHTSFIGRRREALLGFRRRVKPSYAPRRVAEERRTDPNVKTRDVAARGARIRFVEAGAGRPLILLHDYLSSRIAWDAAIPRLASRYRVIAPDLPGFGESEKPPHGRYAYGFEAFAESIVDLVAAIGASRVSICGHALGGAVAVAVAAAHPHVVDRLVLVNPLVYPERVDLLARVASVPLVGAFAFKQLYSRTLFRRYVQQRAYGPRARDGWSKVDEWFDLFNTPSGREAGHATLLAMQDTRSLSAGLSRVNAPTLVAWGREDATEALDDGRRVSREIRSARFEAIEGGRSPHEQAPDSFVDGLVRFLEESRGA